MRPIAIFRHSKSEGPGYFAIFLERHRIPWQLIPIDAGAPVPTDLAAYAGFCFMGGPMSVNDPLPWIEPACDLIRRAHASNIPVIGHCLGGQLMSKALGGRVSANPVKEIGWGAVSVCASDQAKHWLDGQISATTRVFHWHGETFSLPPGATRLLENAWCRDQAFVLGPHLGMQCHVEMLPEMIRRWCKAWDEEVDQLGELAPSIQTPAQMLEEMSSRLPAMRSLADQLYSAWISGLER